MADAFMPDWPAPPQVKALATLRTGGVSQGPYASFNLGDHVGDDPVAVAENRRRLAEGMPAMPHWLQQVHGVQVARAGEEAPGQPADASFARRAGVVCGVMTADCLPVLLCDRAGTVVAAAHAGWRGLCDGVLEATVASMAVAPGEVLAWLGPAIGPDAFEVGDEVRAAFCARDALAAQAFKPRAGVAGKWLADIYLLARQRLGTLGVTRVYGGDQCTVTDHQRFFSYRRDGVTGRMGSFIWLDDGMASAGV